MDSSPSTSLSSQTGRTLSLHLSRHSSPKANDCHSLPQVLRPGETPAWQSLGTSPTRLSPRYSAASLHPVSATRSNLSPADSVSDSLSSSPLSQALKSSFESSDSEQKFKIRNTETGEEIDLRDENKQDFVAKLNQVLQSKSDALEHF